MPQCDEFAWVDVADANTILEMSEHHPSIHPAHPPTNPGSLAVRDSMIWPKPLAWLPRRLRIITIGVLLVLSISLLLTLLAFAKTGQVEAFHLWWHIALGPWAGLFAVPTFTLREMGITTGILAVLMLAHPIVPHWSTAILSLLGFAGWVFIGMAISFISV